MYGLFSSKARSLEIIFENMRVVYFYVYLATLSADDMRGGKKGRYRNLSKYSCGFLYQLKFVNL
jgi:hypothetical protein